MLLNTYQFELFTNIATLIIGYILFYKYFLKDLKGNDTFFNISYLIFALIYLIVTYINKDTLEKRQIVFTNEKFVYVIILIISLAFFYSYFDKN
tara:strand:- start:644 stop:925 length:282 start_codon:yes stop_codon:yes gene_type:complete